MSKVNTKGTFNEATVRTWMRRHLEDHRSHRTSEVDWTGLCEAAARAFDKDYEDGPLDDHTHWIWDLALEVDEQHSERARGRVPSSGQGAHP